MIENYFIHILTLIGIYIIIAIGMNVTVGNLGLLSLGNIAFYGIGAYTSAILSLNGVPFLLAFIMSGIFGGISAMFMTYIMKKLNGDYYAIGTLSFTFVVYSIFLNWTSFTRGALGILGVPKPKIFDFIINTPLEYLFFVFFIVLICSVIFYLILKSPYSLVVGSIRDSEVSARVLGYDTFKIKMQVMFIVGFFTGIAGSLYAHYITFVDPSAFSLHEVILVFTIIIIGGLGSLNGSIFGTIFIIFLPEPLRLLEISPSIIGPMRQIIYSCLLLIIIWFRPKGIFGKVEL